MPYVFDPVKMSYIWYAEGTKPPKTSSSTANEVVPGFAQAYSSTFPNQPGSMALIGGDSGGGSGAPNPDGSYTTDDGMKVEILSGGSGLTSSTSTGTADENKNRNAYEYLQRLFEGYGLGTLAPKILEYIQQGYDPDTISLMLQDTAEYKQRFAANDARRAAGMAVLSPAEYLGLERQYRQILSSNGMPSGFYDSNDDFTSWIGGDVSPAEIQDRVQLASSALYSSDSHYLQTLRSYGIGDGDLVAYMLDQSKALPLIQKTVRASMVGAEASRNSLGISQGRAEYFADMGVTGDQARQAYSTIAENLPTAGKLGRLSGENYGQTDLEDELLGGSGPASAKRKRLATQEVSRFAGASGAGDKALSGRSRGEY